MNAEIDYETINHGEADIQFCHWQSVKRFSKHLRVSLKSAQDFAIGLYESLTKTQRVLL